jgi:hypothetical protein
MKGGYDPAEPVVVWRQENVVLDGHTRVAQAIKHNILVAVIFRDEPDENEAIIYAYCRQINRRQLSHGAILVAVSAVDKRRGSGGDHKSEKSKASRDAFDSKPLYGHHKTAKETGDALGISQATVERSRTILDYAEKTGDDTEMKAVANGKSITSAATDSRTKLVPKRREAVRKYFEANPDATIKVASVDLKIGMSTLAKDRDALGLTDRRGPSIQKPITPKAHLPYSGPIWKNLIDGHAIAMKRIHEYGGIKFVAHDWKPDRVASAIDFAESSAKDFARIADQLRELSAETTRLSPGEVA